MTNSPINHNIEPEDLHRELHHLVVVACEHPPGSLRWQQLVNQLIYQMQRSGKIWRGWGVTNDDYQDALQQTWIWFCQNLSQYDPAKGSVINWFNNHLNFRLRDFRGNRWNAIILNNPKPDWMDNLTAPGEPQPILEEILEWIETEKTKLRRIHVCRCPHINCQALLLRRLFSYTETWEEIAREFKVSAGTISGFYNRRCFPKLLAFGKEQGYLDP